MSLHFRFVLPLSLAVIAIAAHCAVGGDAKQTAPEAPTSPRASSECAKSLAALVDAFNRHDAEAFAAGWETDALLVTKPGNIQIKGRAAIAEAYTELFTNDPKARLAFHIISERAVTPNVVSIQGYADVQHSSGEVTRSEVNAILVEQNGKWLIDEVDESEVALPSEAASHLAQIGWLMGRWTGDLPGGLVTNDAHLADNGRYIVRAYRQEEKGAATREGTQVIAWDAEHQALRSWLFDASGAFGEGIWHAESPTKWINKMAIVLPDGRRGSLTQVFEQAADGKLTIQTIDRDVDGAPQPNSEPVSLVRASR